MLTVISPAKKLDFETESVTTDSSGEPRLMADTLALMKTARKLTAADLKSMMDISDALADLNVARFKDFKTPFDDTNARPALDAFKGDVYVGLDAPSLSDADRQYAHKHLRILSGLYGVLRPLELMQAYRLEMGTRFKSSRGETLYKFWGRKIADLLTEDARSVGADVLVNLASTEYFKAVDRKALGVRVITPVFKEFRGDKAKIISFSAKKARGLMARYIIDNRIENVSALKDFAFEGYRFDADLSNESDWVFTRAAVMAA